ncbi:MAG TPA: cytochrome c [Terracidiphilus sp.]|jgi:cytochrome c5|nr:cytochrome c [Terracidiphilus sp.]
MLNSYLVVCVAVLMAAAAGPAPQTRHQDAQPKQEGETILVAPPSPEAKAIYKRDCALCHGDDGKGQTDLAKSMQLIIDDWSNPKTLAAKTDHDLIETIRAGKDKMPPEPADRANDAVMKGMIQYIREFAKAAPAATVEPSK